MDLLKTSGRLFVAVALAAFGFQYILFAMGRGGPVPGPPWYPSSAAVAWLVALLFGAGAAALAIPKNPARAALALGAYFLLHLVVVHGPKVAERPTHAGLWTSAFEMVAMTGGLWVLAGTQRPDGNAERALSMASAIGRYAFALPLVAFGFLHAMYAAYVATLVPAWIPGHLFWAYAVGVAFVLAGLAITANIQARLAATMLGLMFASWVVVLHLPRAIAAAESGNEWTSTFVALTMAGCSFAVAAASPRKSTVDAPGERVATT